MKKTIIVAAIAILAITVLLVSGCVGQIQQQTNEEQQETVQEPVEESQEQEVQNNEPVEQASESTGNYDSLAQCLTEKGVIMYGTEWCGFCKKQKEAFGDSFQYIDYIDCDQNREACNEAGISGYPTWQIDGELSPGLTPLENLASLAGCEI
jgi:glutaredoxin